MWRGEFLNMCFRPRSSSTPVPHAGAFTGVEPILIESKNGFKEPKVKRNFEDDHDNLG